MSPLSEKNTKRKKNAISKSKSTYRGHETFGTRECFPVGADNKN